MKTFPTLMRASLMAGCAALSLAATTPAAMAQAIPGIAGNLQVYYDFEHPDGANPAFELDQGLSGTTGWLVNGGGLMRVADGAWAGSSTAIQTGQMSGTNDDWKAGTYTQTGVPTLNAFASASAITIMGFVKPTGSNPSLNTNTASPTDFYNAVGLMGLLSGNSNGHDVRALLEVIDVSGTLRLVALGRRVDGASSRTFAATTPWQELIPMNEWTHLAATFNFTDGTMALYRNGVAIAGTYTAAGNSWGTGVTSATNPSGIKIGGSYPQDTAEANPFNGRFDELMYLNRALTAAEVAAQYAVFAPVPEPGTAALMVPGLLGAALLLRRRQRRG